MRMLGQECRLLDFRLYTRNIQLRVPFSFGRTKVDAMDHLVLEARFCVDGAEVVGYSADNLVPKWFRKDPAQTYAEEVGELIRTAVETGARALQINDGRTAFGFWFALYQSVKQAPESRGRELLVAALGISLFERAAIDAVCRRHETPFDRALRTDVLGVDLATLDSNLRGHELGAFLPSAGPSPRLFFRHTVGLSDVLSGDSSGKKHPNSLHEYIRAHGLRYFKVKVGGRAHADAQRVREIYKILKQTCDHVFFVSIDGNESYESTEELAEFWAELHRDTDDLELLQQSLLFVEQPFRRDRTLGSEFRDKLAAWPKRPPLIIDEADAEIDAFPQAVACGYIGTSHKNCKGIFKSFLNLARLTLWNDGLDHPRYVLSGEDLTTIAPIALMQDLCVASTLGLTHLERNGHHYVGALDHLGQESRSAILKSHADLFVREGSETRLNINAGRVSTQSVHEHALGMKFTLSLEGFTRIF